jgi:hypothetical protein
MPYQARLPSDPVVKHPDREVQARIGLIFQMVLEKRSVRQPVPSMHEHHLTVPIWLWRDPLQTRL